jgi:hypothetical protein
MSSLAWNVIAVDPRDLRLNNLARLWCKLPYRDHPGGCPSYGKKPSCPPRAPLIAEFIDLSRPIFAVWVRFDLAAHKRKWLAVHPTHSDRQAGNLLYWQPRVIQELRDHASSFSRFLTKTSILSESPSGPPAAGTRFTLCPEAMGVNVIATALRLGIPVSLHPQRDGTVYKIAIIGYEHLPPYPVSQP